MATYIEEFAQTAKPVSEEEFAKQAHFAKKTTGDLHRFVFSVHFFNPGWTWQQAEAEVKRIMEKHPNG